MQVANNPRLSSHSSTMARLIFLVSLIALAYGARATKEVTKLQIGVKVMITRAVSINVPQASLAHFAIFSSQMTI